MAAEVDKGWRTRRRLGRWMSYATQQDQESAESCSGVSPLNPPDFIPHAVEAALERGVERRHLSLVCSPLGSEFGLLGGKTTFRGAMFDEPANS